MNYSIIVTNPITSLDISLSGNFENCLIERKRITPLIIRSQFSGSIRFYGSDFTTLKSFTDNNYYSVQAKVRETKKDLTYTEYSGELLLRGKWNYAQFVCELEFIHKDAYWYIFDNPEKNWETSFNILNASDTQYSIFVDTVSGNIDFLCAEWFYSDPEPAIPTTSAYKGFKEWAFFYLGVEDYQYKIYVREHITRNKINGRLWGISNGWQLLSQTTTTFDVVRPWDYKYSEYNSTYYSYSINETICNAPNYLTMPFTGEIKKVDVLWRDAGISKDVVYCNKWKGLSDFYGGNIRLAINLDFFKQTRKYTRNLLFADVVSYLLGQFDSSITTDASTFDWFNDSLEFKNLLIGGIKDVTTENIPRMIEILDKLEDDESLTTDEIIALADEYDTMLAATEVSFDFKRLMTFLAENIHLHWYLEEISGVFYLRFKHYSDITFDSELIHDDIINNDNFISFDNSNYYSLLNRESESDYSDFKGVDQVFTEIPAYMKKSITPQDIYVDIWTTIENNVTKEGGIFLWTCEEATTQNLIYYFSNLFDDPDLQYSTLTFTNSDKKMTGVCATNIYISSSRSNKFGLFVVGEILSISFTVTTNTTTWTNMVLSNGTNTYDMINEVYNPVAGVWSNLTPGDYTFEVEISELLEGQLFIDVFSYNNTGGQIVIENISITQTALSPIKSIGEISGIEIPNNYLSTSYLDENYISETPAVTGTINNATKTGLVKVRDKKMNVKYKTALLVDNYDFSKYVYTSSGNFALESVKRYCNGNFDELELSLIE